PDTFVSSAMIRVLPPQVPEGLIAMPMNIDMSQRMNQMTQGILSRANLTNIINTHQLYRRELLRLPMEDVIEDMRTKAIGVQAMSGTGGASSATQKNIAFAISFKYAD